MITILMSTYNGARYIEAQLDSILAQDMPDWRLVVRDDGSTDGTTDILQRYTNRDPRIQWVSDGNNRGAMRSFEYLLSEYGGNGYVAFADQDDVWLSDKLRLLQNKMQESEEQYGADTPIVVRSDLIVTDENLHIVSKSFWQYSFIKPAVLNERAEYLAICNSVTGCTMLLNQSARKAALPFGEKALMHDSAIAVNVKRKQGMVVYINRPTMYYRQHGDNTLGAVKYRFWRSWSIRLKEARMHYQAYHPDVFCNVWAFIYWKLRCFCAEHL